MGERARPSVDTCPEVVIRPFAGQQEYRQCVQLQRDTWGPSFAELVPPALLQVTQKMGGIAAGAFDKSDRMVGFVYGLTGMYGDRLTHWSHMLAVSKEWEGRGLGQRLKAYQRSRLLDLGIETALWTFEPLESRNAHFNLNRLGVTVVRYVPDMYGDTGSELHSGLGTDRFLVRWDLRSERVARALSHDGMPTPAVPPGSPMICVDEEGAPAPRTEPYPTGSVVRLAVPPDIQAVKAQSIQLAQRWRDATRRALSWYLDRGYTVSGFGREAATGTCSYILLLADSARAS